MVDVPERIWAASVTENYGEWQTATDGLPRPTEYVRADLYAALEAKLANVKERAKDAASSAAEVTEEDWREIKQAVQPRIRDGYTDIKVSKPGFWFVKGSGPAVAQEAGKP